MKTETHQLFAYLCETILAETSSAMGLIKGHSGGQQIVKFLHAERGLGHDQGFEQIEKIKWNVLKDMHRGGWVILSYPNGTGAIRQKSGGYEAIASTGGEPVTFKNDRGGNILDFLKTHLGGNPTKYFQGEDKGNATELKKSRAQSRQSLEKIKTIDNDGLVDKFRPLWAKAMEAAIADVKGMIATMIKNDAFVKAERKLKQVSLLTQAAEQMQLGSKEPPNFIKPAVRNAVMMAAVHFYPDETGEIQKSYNGHETQNTEGPKHVLSDIANGDTKKLGTVLAFFKRELITG